MYWSPNFLAVVERRSYHNAVFSIWVFKNFPGVIPTDPLSGRGRPPPALTPASGRARGSSAPVLGPKPWSLQLFSRVSAPGMIWSVFLLCHIICTVYEIVAQPTWPHWPIVIYLFIRYHEIDDNCLT